jgi:hypothetical protein
MNWMEISLIILGVVAFIGSYLVKDKSERGGDEPIEVDPEIIRDMVDKEMEEARERLNDAVDETIQNATEKTERASERISNEKIMAINEYSETVLADINKSHQEVMFLYDMLNDKHENIKETVKQVDKTAKEAVDAIKEASNESIAIKETAQAAQTVTAQVVKEAGNVVKETAVEVKEPERVERAEVVNVDKAPENVAAEVDISREFYTQKPIETPVSASAEISTSVEIPTSMGIPTSIGTQTEIPAGVPVETEEEQSGNNNDRILEMHKAGVDTVDIAKELGLGVGEVKLVINLFKGAI